MCALLKTIHRDILLFAYYYWIVSVIGKILIKNAVLDVGESIEAS